MPRIPIFNYHTVTDHPRPGIAGFAVRPDDLARHLDLIVARHCTALTISALVDLLDRDLAPPPATVVITFDDGYEDNLTVAAPLLVARGLPATVFVTTGFLPGCPGGSIAEPAGPDAPVGMPPRPGGRRPRGGIPLPHPSGDGRPVENRRQPRDPAQQSPAGGRPRPLRSTASPIPTATPPAGCSRRLRDAGFRSACGVRDAFSHPGDNRWLLSRLIVGPTTTCDQIDGLLRGTGAPDRRRPRAPPYQGVAGGPAGALRPSGPLPSGRTAALAGAGLDRQEGGQPCDGRDDGSPARRPVRLVDVELGRPLGGRRAPRSGPRRQLRGAADPGATAPPAPGHRQRAPARGRAGRGPHGRCHLVRARRIRSATTAGRTASPTRRS